MTERARASVSTTRIGQSGSSPKNHMSPMPGRLTKGLWKGKDELDLARNARSRCRHPHGAEDRLGRSRRTPRLDDAGENHSYERLLLATGGTPRRFGSAPDDVIYYRTLDTYHRLRALAGDGVRVTVIGGGFIGSEIAAALAMNDCAVTIVFLTRASARGYFRGALGVRQRVLPLEGVDVLPGEGCRDRSGGRHGSAGRHRRRTVDRC